MSERTWTKDQLRAIEFDKKNLILSAAAGSGKTATLTERIIRLLKDPEKGADLSRMLIVTFTNAAAGELRERIGAALSAALADDPCNRFLAGQLTNLEGAHISTIDSFFQSEIRPYFSALSLPPDFRVADEAESQTLRDAAMAETVSDFFDGLYETDREEFIRFSDCLSDARTQGDLAARLLKISDHLLSYGVSGEDLLKNAEELEKGDGDLFACSYCDPVKEKLRQMGEYYSMRFERAASALASGEKTEKYVDGAVITLQDAKMLMSLPEKTYSQAREALYAIELPTLIRFTGEQPEEYTEYKDLRSSFIGEIKDLRVDCFGDDSENTKRAMQETARIIRVLEGVNKVFREKYAFAKRERGVIDFSDAAVFAKQLFVSHDSTPTERALEIGKKFDYIFIDEYQDTNNIQDSIFSAISQNSKLFMVGDVKQSIYGFRGSCPQLFCDYREKFAQKEDSEAVFMSENFRSDHNILKFANTVSRYIFAAGATPFEKEDELICSKIGGKTDKKCEVLLVEPESSDGQALPSEPESVAMRISELLEGECLSSGERVRPGDIAILLRSATHAEDYARELSARGIPVNNLASEDFFNYSEVLMILCILNAADNPLRDIYLAGALKSPVFSFTLNQLITIRQNTDIPLWYSLCRYAENGKDKELSKKCAGFIGMVDRWRSFSREMSADEIFRLIVSDTSLRSYGGDGIRSNRDIVRTLKILSGHAAKVGRAGGTLHDLISHLNSVIEKTDKAEGFADPDSVSIITIHRSKGLEYPVCFLCEQAKRFNARDTYDKLLTDRKGRIAVKLYDGAGLVRCHTPLRGALALQMVKESIEEDARVLYVAMTRAREKLIVTCKTKNASARLSEGTKKAEYPLTVHEIMTQKSSGDWIIDALQRDGAGDCFVYRTNSSLIDGSFEKDEKETGKSLSLEEFFEKSLDFSYDKEYLENIPAKLTVSTLKPDVLGSGEEEATSFEQRTVTKLPDKAPIPSFMQEKGVADSAERGTATHIFMQFCDFENLEKNGADSELQRLLDMRFISERNASLVRLSEIERFAQSEIFQRLLGAKSVIRERRFNTVLPAADFTTDPSLREKLLRDQTLITVQGVVDCIFTDALGKTVLMDYKTDRLTEAELENPALAEDKLRFRHSRQLLIYKEICEGMLERPFDEVLIYSLHLGRAVKVC